ncbi:hypothetical protein LOC54_04250 [Acetobacter sp. AN02]|uniref:YMGG-like glycine zipper-containing protein n=1 Tax=Acetobacter sp. AN02 TaxID=2894186 RepID=UPI0024341FDF|nr:YMGG-like glycine zipper-containing protein [Acetobacter sp. AN02]MDG6094328.1 hypothetical protein [Acetobacter sp. AN02]
MINSKLMRRGSAAAALIGTALTLTACGSPYSTTDRAGSGALIGGGSGAAIGALAGGGRGAAIGALAGGLLGAGVGAVTTPNAPNTPTSGYQQATPQGAYGAQHAYPQGQYPQGQYTQGQVRQIQQTPQGTYPNTYSYPSGYQSQGYSGGY